jgi:hypothetical protein
MPRRPDARDRLRAAARRRPDLFPRRDTDRRRDERWAVVPLVERIA